MVELFLLFSISSQRVRKNYVRYFLIPKRKICIPKNQYINTAVPASKVYEYQKIAPSLVHLKTVQRKGNDSEKHRRGEYL